MKPKMQLSLNESLAASLNDYDIHALEESLIYKLAEAGLTIKNLGVVNNELRIVINGHEYGYMPISGSVDDLNRTFSGMLKYSAGRALAWLKKHSKLSSGSKKKS